VHQPKLQLGVMRSAYAGAQRIARLPDGGAFFIDQHSANRPVASLKAEPGLLNRAEQVRAASGGIDPTTPMRRPFSC